MRRYRPLSEFEAAIRELQSVQQDLTAAVSLCQANNLGELLCHADNIFERRIPELVAWSGRINSEAIEQCRAITSNRKSRAEQMLDKAARMAAKAGVKKRGLSGSRSAVPAAPDEDKPKAAKKAKAS